MSGHSKWATIRRQKATNDAKKGKLFTKIARDIIMAVQEAGADLDTNFRLRLLVNRARGENMPADNIQKAIAKGAGQTAGALTSITYEGYGPANLAILVDCQTDNTNRTVTEVKQVLEKHGGKLSAAGTVAWQFGEYGRILLAPEKFWRADQFGKQGNFTKVDTDEMLLNLIEIPGVEDVEALVEAGQSLVQVICAREQFSQVHQQVERLGYHILEASLAKLAKDAIPVTDPAQVEKVQTLLEALEDQSDVISVWHNGQF